MKSRPRIDLTPEQIEWLREAHKLKVHVSLMAIHLGYHQDTIKRLLDRYGIKEALSSKHITHKRTEDEIWTRPCLKCKSTKPRPKNQYICDDCKTSSGGLSDEYLFT